MRIKFTEPVVYDGNVYQAGEYDVTPMVVRGLLQFKLHRVK